MRTNCSKVEIQQVKHQEELPIEISLSLVKKLLKKAKIQIEDGHAYHLYDCGHVIDSENDKRVVKHFKGHTCNMRVCPICWENHQIKARLITKYKRCQCGSQHFSLRIQPSTCCHDCSASRRALQGKTPNCELWNNNDKADPSRCFCIHRKDCIDEYRNYNVIPCKECKKFEEKEGVWY